MSLPSSARLRVSAVSYLNTSPLVWGILHGPQTGAFDLRFELPAVCAESLKAGTADLGLVPVIEIERQGLASVPSLGIASDGPVRSILLISKVPAQEIATVAMDSSSRTSVALARIVLAEKYGIRPLEAPPTTSDAVLIIGDPALRYDIAGSPEHVYDLGQEWRDLSGLPMVYAMWAGRFPEDVPETLRQSYEYGHSHLEDIIASDARDRGFPAPLARDYLTRRIEYVLTPRHRAGLACFLEFARKHDAV